MRVVPAKALVLCLCVLLHAGHAGARTNSARVQDLVDDLRTKLSIPQAVVVTIVPRNPLVVSVTRQKGSADGFALTIEDGFLETLSDAEVSAVAAHELGHVWIFTHHPFLQTEEGANEVALRVVSRETLNRLYDKVWQRAGAQGDLVYMPVK